MPLGDLKWVVVVTTRDEFGFSQFVVCLAYLPFCRFRLGTINLFSFPIWKRSSSCYVNYLKCSAVPTFPTVLRHDILSCFLQHAKFPFSMKETTKYLFGKLEKHKNGKNKPKTNEDG